METRFYDPDIVDCVGSSWSSLHFSVEKIMYFSLIFMNSSEIALFSQEKKKNTT